MANIFLKSKLWVIAIAVSFLFVACSGEKKNNDEQDKMSETTEIQDDHENKNNGIDHENMTGKTHQEMQEPVAVATFENVSTAVKPHINKLLGHYFDVKNALTKDSP